ncbi:DNL zinc finger-domain-containing protein [Endogone sp. FLAS-F59071]|nr:DNL zinc finger-domain-containing protein [Endogone sp. FLAS-F59071]|eukprot:RUS20831.1 DNL zinc finger-domain-containing protein [Endogone sp. FLAS-F59071]
MTVRPFSPLAILLRSALPTALPAIKTSRAPPLFAAIAHNFHSSCPCPPLHEDHPKDDAQPSSPPADQPNQPKSQMLIAFTCKVCSHRTHHVMSKQAYTTGVVIIQCAGCKNRHLIADHLGWFRDGSTTVEDLVRENGETVRKLVSDGGDVMEWLPDVVEEEKEVRAKAKAKAERLKLENQVQD